MKDKSVFLAEGIAYYKGNLIVINNAEGNLTAYRFSKNKVEINKGFFKDGIMRGKGDSMKYPVAVGDRRLYFPAQRTGIHRRKRCKKCI